MKDSIRCIVAEDFLDLNRIYTDILNYESDIMVIHNAFSGEELIEILNEKTPDVILLDVEMETPEAGIQYCRRISAQYPDIRIIILTCHEEEEKILAAFEAGAVDYILKTSSMAEVILSIRNVYKQDSPIHGYAANTIRKKMREIGDYKRQLKEFTLAFSSLTPAEIGILKLSLKGLKQREIAETKHIELVTVKTHVGHIIKKFNCSRIQEVVDIIRSLDMTDFVSKAPSV
jgi:DNA-binding NarL/FixJ family response regulator